MDDPELQVFDEMERVKAEIYRDRKYRKWKSPYLNMPFPAPCYETMGFVEALNSDHYYKKEGILIEISTDYDMETQILKSITVEVIKIEIPYWLHCFRNSTLKTLFKYPIFDKNIVRIIDKLTGHTEKSWKNFHPSQI